MNIQDRIEFYLGVELLKNNANIHNDPNKMTIKNKRKIKEYDEPFEKLLRDTNNQDKYFKWVFGDVGHETDCLTLVKNRHRGCNKSVILRCLNFGRHWEDYYKNPKEPIAHFSKKIPILFWRGTTTGRIEYPANRFLLIEKWFNKHPSIDIGLSHICQGKDAFKKYVKNKCNISHFLNYKYILSVEGNDKDSGLNWKLNSNSVVFMAKPRVTSWLMETTLVPNYHYVLLKDDFSDLLEKIIWCNNNQNKCIEIIRNANRFMSQFANHSREIEIEKKVINNYFKLIKA
jgi:hypothetical protein